MPCRRVQGTKRVGVCGVVYAVPYDAARMALVLECRGVLIAVNGVFVAVWCFFVFLGQWSVANLYQYQVGINRLFYCIVANQPPFRRFHRENAAVHLTK